MKMDKKYLSISIILFLSLILFYKPLFSNQPLGLDTLGHLSKVSYLKLYPFANWDMSWYSGTLSLKIYPPLFYYLAAPFPNVFFAANFLSFISIILTSLGIYFLIKYKTKDERIALFSGLSYLTVLSISYYWISTGNLPYFFALWTIPFSLYFLERSINEKKKRYFVIYSIIFSLGILTHVIIGFIIGVLMILRILFLGLGWKNIQRVFFYGIIPVLLSSFWFVPFLFYSSSSGGYEGYVPKITQLFGSSEQTAWGLGAGGVGILIILFIASIFILKRYYKDRTILASLFSILILGFLLLGGLGSHYPLGVDPVRFILPFSIAISLFIGLVIHKSQLFTNKYILILLFLTILLGLFWNMQIINKNLETFSYYKEDSRYGIISNIISQKDFPLENKFENYRFGTSKFVFGENLNYFLPNVPQTMGYQDAGMLNAPRYYDMRWNIWLSNDTNQSVYWLDGFGIKYFEAENKDFVEKFKKDPRFKIIMNGSGGYDFTLFEYLDAKHIIALVDYVSDSSLGKEKEFEWQRTSPDQVTVTYSSIDENDAVLFKEFYHKTWKASDLNGKPLEIHRNQMGFMFVNPLLDSKGVVFYQSKTPEDYLGVLLTLLGIVLLIIYSTKKINL